MSLPNVVFVLGGPGAGKGTQCKRIEEKYGFIHLCAGDMLRAEAKKSESEFGATIAKYMNEGSIVPVAITCKLLEKAMNEKMAESPPRKNFILDGFPRNKDNLDGWVKEMAGITNLLFVLFFDCSADTSVSRCIKRGEEGSGRADDTRECMDKRIAMNAEIKVVVDHYEALGLVRRINSERSVDEVFAEVQAVFDAAVLGGI